MSDKDFAVPLTNVTKFVRQLSHDVRNYLNAAELQAAFVSEIADNEEVKNELKRLREMVSELGVFLQRLTSALGDVKVSPMPYAAVHLMDDLRQKVGTQFPDSADAIQWQPFTDDKVTLEIDPQYVQQAFVELFANALQHRTSGAKIVVSGEVAGDHFVVKLAEPKTEACDPSQWTEPFRTIGRGRYGLGLYRAGRIVTAQSGAIDIQFDRGGQCLISAVRLPLAKASSG